MKKFVIASAVALAAQAPACCAPASNWMNLRVTVELTDDGHPISATAVWRTRFMPSFSGPAKTRFEGDAIVINLGRRGYLFALPLGMTPGLAPSVESITNVPDALSMKADEAMHWPNGPMRNRIDYRNYVINRYSGRPIPICLKGDAAGVQRVCLTLVRFLDPKKPTSARFVDPHNLSATYGPGISLRMMQIQITRQSRTTSDLSMLPWLASTESEWIAGGRSADLPADAPHSLIASNFKSN
jgi:hypothetical protein